MSSRRPPEWGGIRSGTFTIHALGRDRAVTIDLTGELPVRMDMGAAQPTPVPEHLLAQTLDKVRAAAPPAEADEAVMDELRAENAEAMARDDYGCVFDSDTDPQGVPEGFGCGGCACHLSAPCQHCTRHLPTDESAFIASMLNHTGRGGGLR